MVGCWSNGCHFELFGLFCPSIFFRAAHCLLDPRPHPTPPCTPFFLSTIRTYAPDQRRLPRRTVQAISFIDGRGAPSTYRTVVSGLQVRRSAWTAHTTSCPRRAQESCHVCCFPTTPLSTSRCTACTRNVRLLPMPQKVSQQGQRHSRLCTRQQLLVDLPTRQDRLFPNDCGMEIGDDDVIFRYTERD